MHSVPRLSTLTALLATLALLGAAAPPAPLRYPPAKTVPVTDTYFGTVVADPYRWLESPNDPEVKPWAAAQTKLAADYLAGRPSYAGYKARIAALSRTSTSRFEL